MPKSFGWWLAVGQLLLLVRASPLPIYFGNNHAGAFYFIAINSDPQEKADLLLIDEHCDSSPIFPIDDVRDLLLTDPKSLDWSIKADWCRTNGLVQCFNWINPLFANRIKKVTWIPKDRLDSDEKIQMQYMALNYSRGFSTDSSCARPVDSSCWEVQDLRWLEISQSETPIHVSLDLDYLVETKESEVNNKVAKIFSLIFRLKNIRSLSVCLSRPWLQSKSQSDLLAFSALNQISGLMNSKMTFNIREDFGNDVSELSKKYYRRNESPPTWSATDSPKWQKAFYSRWTKDWIADEDGGKWQGFLLDFKHTEKNLMRIVCNSQYTDSGVHHFKLKEKFEIQAIRGNRMPSDARWWILSSPESSYNLGGQDSLFANTSSTYFRVVFREIDQWKGNCTITSQQVYSLLHNTGGCGSIRIFSQDLLNPGMLSDECAISIRRNDSFLGYIAESFNLPYVLGAALLVGQFGVGPESALGVDCATFVIHAARRCGMKIPWVSPANIYQYMDILHEVNCLSNVVYVNKDSRPIYIAKDEIDGGLIAHFGVHLAVIWKDIRPIGILDSRDLVVHDLEGFPKIEPLGDISFASKPFKICRFSKKISSDCVIKEKSSGLK
jgi:hypothetical protein